MIVATRTYVLVFVALLGLLALTIAAATLDLGTFNSVVAMGIALVKMLLVLSFFMHLKYDSGLIRVFALAGFLWFALLFVGSLHDYFTRFYLPYPAY